MIRLLSLLVVVLVLGGCSMLSPSSPQSGQALAVVGSVQSLAACIQNGVKSIPKSTPQAQADATTQVVTSCLNTYEPAIVAAALAATQK